MIPGAAEIVFSTKQRKLKKSKTESQGVYTTGGSKSDRKRSSVQLTWGSHEDTDRVNMHSGLTIAPHLCGWGDVWGLNACEGLDIAEPSRFTKATRREEIGSL